MADSRLDLSKFHEDMYGDWADCLEVLPSMLKRVHAEALRAQASEDTLRKRVEELEAGVFLIRNTLPHDSTQNSWITAMKKFCEALGAAGGEG